MNGTKSQYLRWVEILDLIRAGRVDQEQDGYQYGRGLVNSKYIAGKLGVCEKTVLRDINYLCLSVKAPIEYDFGRRGYYMSEPTYTLKSGVVTESNLRNLVMAECALKVLGLNTLADSVGDALNVIGSTRRAMLDSCRARANACLNQDSGRVPESIYWKPIFKACMENKDIRVNVLDSNGTKEWWNLSRGRLYVKSGIWFLSGYSNGQDGAALERITPLSQVQNVQVLKKLSTDSLAA